MGRIVIECYGSSWAYTWGAMGDNSLESFFTSCDNGYLINKMVKDTTQTDFDEINKGLEEAGIDTYVTNDVEIAMAYDDMVKAFGPEWFMEAPRCNTQECNYLSLILDAIKEAFKNAQ